MERPAIVLNDQSAGRGNIPPHAAELLRPADATGWKGAIGSVENALVDDDLQAWSQTALDKGVQVIGLIDACHSATGFRAIGGQGVPRGIDEAQLGIPDDVVPVDIRYRCSVCGAEVTMTAVNSEQELEAPRHCREDMLPVWEASS